ncbi:hypothetical protein CcI49_19070 [Frankia sp. CcI49]|nr:hypothetical protein CcI49_19070 [Frankia sp. CcI49]
MTKVVSSADRGAAAGPTTRKIAPVTVADGSPDPSQPRRGRNRNAAAHQAILDATEALVRERGYAAVTIEEIAARAGVGKATVYRWWPSRAYLAVELIMDRWLEWGGIPDTGDTRQDLIEFSSVNFRNQIGIAGQVMQQLAADSKDALQQLRERFVKPRREMGRTILERAVRRGDLPPNADLELILDILAGVPAYQTYYAGRIRDLRDIDQMVDLVLHGITPTRRRGRPRTAGANAPRGTNTAAPPPPAQPTEAHHDRPDHSPQPGDDA